MARRFRSWLNQRTFRYGQAALANRDWRPVVPLWRANPAPRDDITPGLMIIQKDGDVGRGHLWVGAVLHEQHTETVSVTITATDRANPGDRHTRAVDLHWFSIDSEREITGWAPGTRFFHTHCTLPHLPGTWYDVHAEFTDAELAARFPAGANCLLRTLPPRLDVGERLSVFTASCYDVDTDEQNSLSPAYDKVFTNGRRPDLTWFTGDAVYADAPWWLYSAMARKTPRTYGLLEYWSAWGMQSQPNGESTPGMRSLLTAGPNWFLPDDHEFWNNWPHASATARHSYGNFRQAFWGTVGRWLSARLAPVRDDDQVGPPRDPAVAPGRRNRAAQSYLPVHPDEWGRWARASFDLFGSFQTRSVCDRTTGRITYGERDENPPPGWQRPPGGTAAYHLHEPLNQIVQTIDLDPVQVTLLDTRTRRVRALHHPLHSNFVDERYLQQMLEVARRAPVFILVLAQPVLRTRAAGTCRGTKHVHRRLTFDRGMEDYCHQYQRFWTGLMAARGGRPTVTIGGDIHRSYVAHAEQLSLVEIVASPMSLVTGLAAFDPIVHPWRTLTRQPLVRDPYDPASGVPLVGDVADLFAGPLPVSDLPAGPVLPLIHLSRENGVGAAGFATFDITRAGEYHVRLDVRLHPRDATAHTANPTTPRASFDLYTDRRGPESVVASEVLPTG